VTDVAVVLATHDRAARLRALLTSLREQTLAPDRFEVVIVDDGSRDETPAVLEEELARGVLRLRVLRNDRALGPAVARDAGWRAAQAPFVAFTDDDCRLAPGWLEAGLRAWGGDDARLVQGRTDPEPAEVHTEGPFARTLRIHSLGPYFQTANVFYPRALLERVDGFDTVTFSVPGGEDADLAWRCIESGAQPVWAPAAQAWHAVHQLGPIGKLKVAWRWHETMRLYARHPELRSTLTYKVFWKKSHYLLVRAALGLVVPWRALRFWCFAPLAPAYLERARVEGGQPLAAPYFLLHDAVELAAVVRGAVRYRTPVV
jgi:glycosyltransferase involved in cell wall biosynthesis